MGRIKIIGYIDTADLDPAQLDDTHETGLSSEGYDALFGHDGVGIPLKVSDLEDVEAAYEA